MFAHPPDWRLSGPATLHLVALAALLALAGPRGAFAAEAQPLPRVRVAADGRGFVTSEGRAFVPFGVNYFRPDQGWAPKLWQKFDAEATRADFARMKQLGVNCVRVFLTFGSFYLEAGRLDTNGLAKFDRFLDLAEAAGIYVHPTGPDHWEGMPAWARGDRFADEALLAAQESFWKALAARYRGRNVLFAYDLLNEPMIGWDSPALRAKWNAWLARKYGSAEQLRAAWGTGGRPIEWGQQPPPASANAPLSRELLDYQHFREEVADEWTRRQSAAIKAADPQALVTVGLIQWAVPALLNEVRHYAAFRPARQARFLDFLEVHFYPLDHGAYHYAGAESEAKNLAYLECVTREVAAPGKPVVLAEFGWYGGGQPKFDGGKHPAATEDQQARWNRRVIETTAGLATGWLNWGLYDHPGAGDVTELIGLLRADGEVKAWGREFTRLAGRFTVRRPEAKPLAARPPLDWDLLVRSVEAGHAYRARYFEAFAADQAARPKPRE